MSALKTGRTTSAPPRGAATTAGAVRPGRVLLLAVWFALAAAAIELCGRAVQKFVLGHIIEMSRDAVWLAAPGQLILLLPVAAGILLAAGLLRRRPSLTAVVGAYSFVMYLGFLVMPGWFTWYAALLLAGGLALQTMRVVRTRAPQFERLVRAGTPALAALLLATACSISAVRFMRERSALAALGPADGGAPNVILLIWDTVRAASLSLYGHDRATTPNLEVFARQGIVFDRAFAASSWTLPSHGSMFTGQPPHMQTSAWVTPLDGTHPTLAEVFRQNGYETAGFVANTRYADWEHGLARGFIHYEDYIVSPGEMLRSTALGQRLLEGHGGWDRGMLARLVGWEDLPARKSADRVNADFLGWLDDRQDRPYFAFLNYFDAHQSYYPPPEFRTRFEPARAPTSFAKRVRRELERDGYWDMPADELAAELAAYEGAIAYLDDRLGALLRELEQRGELDNTIVVFASDHGEEFKEHGGEAHGTNLYSWQTHVPLVIAWEGRIDGGARVETPVSLSDLPATLADLARLPGGDVFPGASLAGYWRGDAGAAPRPVLAEVSPGLVREQRIQSIVADPFQLIRNEDGALELYDIIADPHQERPLPADSAAGSVTAALLRRLESLTRCAGDVGCCCDAAPPR